MADELLPKKRSEFDKLPQEDSKEFRALECSIIKTFGLSSPVDMAIARRAAKNYWYLEYCDQMIKKYGLFYECEIDGITEVKMNQLAYFIKQLEGEWRSYIRLLKLRKPGMEDKSDKDIFELIKDGKNKAKSSKTSQ